jgi:hypothetical protein
MNQYSELLGGAAVPVQVVRRALRRKASPGRTQPKKVSAIPERFALDLERVAHTAR